MKIFNDYSVETWQLTVAKLVAQKMIKFRTIVIEIKRVFPFNNPLKFQEMMGREGGSTIGLNMLLILALVRI